jgi:hypothetical protein
MMLARPCLLLTFMLMLPFTAAAADRLENTKWKVKVMPDGEAARAGEKPFDDTLIFKAGTFTATECEKHGFKPAPYDDDTRGAPGGMQGFTAELKSEKEGKARWIGTVTADQIKGEMTWTKKDGTELNYTYSGERLPPK